MDTTEAMALLDRVDIVTKDTYQGTLYISDNIEQLKAEIDAPVLGFLAQAYCSKENEHKTVDPTLLNEISLLVIKRIQESLDKASKNKAQSYALYLRDMREAFDWAKGEISE